MSRVSSSTALPIARITLRTLIIANWVVAVMILILLAVSPNERWIMSAFHLSPSPDATRVVMGLRAIAVLGLIGIPLNYIVLTRLLAIVDMTHELKASGQSGAGDLLSRAIDLLPTQLLTPLFRLASRSSVARCGRWARVSSPSCAASCGRWTRVSSRSCAGKCGPCATN